MFRFSWLSKRNILRLFLVLWVIFSAVYIGWNIWSDFRFKMLSQAYQKGVTDAVNQLILEAEKEGCRPVFVYNQADGKQVELVSAACIGGKAGVAGPK